MQDLDAPVFSWGGTLREFHSYYERCSPNADVKWWQARRDLESCEAALEGLAEGEEERRKELLAQRENAMKRCELGLARHKRKSRRCLGYV